VFVLDASLQPFTKLPNFCLARPDDAIQLSTAFLRLLNPGSNGLLVAGRSFAAIADLR
jgi:hypothetical protein